MTNFDMPWDDTEREKTQAKVTPIVCGTPTPEEEAEAFEEIFSDFWRNNR